MKKVTVMLSLFILACAVKSTAQNGTTKPARDTTGKNTKPIAKPTPGTKATDYLMDFDGVKGESVDKKKTKGKEKEESKPIAQPAPGTKADIYIKIDDIKGESRDPKKLQEKEKEKPVKN